MVLGVPNIASAGVAIRPDLRGFGRELQRGLPAPLRDAAGVAAGAIGASVAAASASALQFGGFETQLQRIVGLVGVSQDEVDKLGQSLIDLGPAVGAGPDKLAEALFFVTSAGLRGTDALETVEASARAAAAGLGDIVTVADAATSAMNAYGTDTLTASDATDVLVATVREGKVEADALAGSIGRVIPLAAEAGVSFNEVGAAIAATTRTGLGAEESVTALRGLFATLVSPTQQARDVLAEYGLSAEGLRTQLREDGLLAVLQTLTGTFGGNIDALSGVIPNIRALTGFLSLTGQNAEEVVGIFERMQDVTGTTDDAFGAIANTTEFRLSQAFAELKTELTELGADAAPALVDALSAAAEVAIQALPSLVRFGTTILEVLAGVGDATLRVRSGFEQFSALGQGLAGLFSRGQREAQQLSITTSDLVTSLLSGGDPATSFANALVVLQGRLEDVGSEVGVTSTGFNKLREAALISDRQLLGVAETMLGAVRAGEDIGFTLEDIVRLFGDVDGFGAQVGGTFLTIEERSRLLAAGVITAEQALLGVPPPLDEISAAGPPAAGAIDAVGVAADGLDVGDAAEETSELEQAFRDAAAEGESLRGVIQSLTDPVFAAVDSFISYQEQLEAAREDGEITALEQLELGRTVIGLGADFDRAGTDIDVALEAIGRATGQTKTDVIADLESLGLEVRDNGIGAAIVDGILADLDGLAGRLSGRLIGGVSAALSATRRFAGIQSPSTLFRDQLGRPITEGIAAGISEGAAAVRAALTDSIPVPSQGTAGAGSTRNFNITVVEPRITDVGRAVDSALGVARTQDLLIGVE